MQDVPGVQIQHARCGVEQHARGPAPRQRLHANDVRQATVATIFSDDAHRRWVHADAQILDDVGMTEHAQDLGLRLERPLELVRPVGLEVAVVGRAPPSEIPWLVVHQEFDGDRRLVPGCREYLPERTLSNLPLKTD